MHTFTQYQLHILYLLLHFLHISSLPISCSSLTSLTMTWESIFSASFTSPLHALITLWHRSKSPKPCSYRSFATWYKIESSSCNCCGYSSSTTTFYTSIIAFKYCPKGSLLKSSNLNCRIILLWMMDTGIYKCIYKTKVWFVSILNSKDLVLTLAYSL